MQGLDELVQPAIFGVEVAGGLVRRGTPEQDILDLVQVLGRAPHRVVTIGPRSAAAAAACAMRARLRGADAIYVWLASTRGLTLCTLDDQMAERARSFCTVIVP